MARESPRNRPLSAEELLAYALRLLARRAWSAGELRQKLERRAARPENVGAVFERLKGYGYIDDRRFAEAFSEARLETNGFGKQRVLRDLGRRRVAPELARETVERVFAGVDEPALIEDYLRRKFRGVALREHLAEPRRLAAAYRRLRTAGFSPGNVIRVLKRYAERAEELESLEQAGES